MRAFSALLLTFFLAGAGHADVAVLSYNMGQLKAGGMDLVPCPGSRQGPQVEALLGEASPLRRERYFVLMLQEVYREGAYEALRARAEALGMLVEPASWEEVSDNGEVIITNLMPLRGGFVPYSVDEHVRRGVRHLTLDLGRGRTLGVANVHTAYSMASGLKPHHLAHLRDIDAFLGRWRLSHNHYLIGGDFNAGPDLHYRRETWNPPKELWREQVLPLARRHGLRLASQTARPTWDDAHNPLVNDPTFLIRLYNGWNTGAPLWEELDAVLDHVFVSQGLEVRAARVALDQRVRLSCPGRAGRFGYNAPLSDHYGTLVVLRAPGL